MWIFTKGSACLGAQVSVEPGRKKKKKGESRREEREEEEGKGREGGYLIA